VAVTLVAATSGLPAVFKVAPVIVFKPVPAMVSSSPGLTVAGNPVETVCAGAVAAKRTGTSRAHELARIGPPYEGYETQLLSPKEVSRRVENSSSGAYFERQDGNRLPAGPKRRALPQATCGRRTSQEACPTVLRGPRKNGPSTERNGFSWIFAVDAAAPGDRPEARGTGRLGVIPARVGREAYPCWNSLWPAIRSITLPPTV
jgi:hypothetical protein